MFVYQDAAAAVAMQEIEVVSMDDGEDNVTANIIHPPPHRSAVVASPPPPPPPSSSRAFTTTAAPSDDDDRADGPEEGGATAPVLDVLIAMLADERAPAGAEEDRAARSRIEATPISGGRGGGGGAGAAHAPLAPAGDAHRHDPVNDYDRARMCDWYYEMSDFLKIGRATASRSMSLLDRFMAAPVHRMVRTTTTTTTMHCSSLITASSTLSSSSTSSSATSATDRMEREGEERDHRPHSVAGVVVAASRMRDEYQLAALTALFLSIKLFERINIQLEHVSYLSRGRYTAGEVMRMELVMLHALEWRVCRADKVDFANAYLDVMLPGGGREDDPRRRALLSGVWDLAAAQIKMSDYDPSFSGQRPSLVAFASVINALETRRGDFSDDDLGRVLLTARWLVALTDRRGERGELLRTAERLRALADPPSSSAPRDGGVGCWYFFCGGPSSSSSPPSSVDPVPAPRRGGGGVVGNDMNISVDDASPSSSDTPSQGYAKVSPLDVALESMESLIVARLLCCGSIDHPPPHRCDDVDSDGHRGNHDRIAPPGKKRQHGHAATNGRGGIGMANSHSSPTSITTIIFGAEGKKV
jgi:hypothetical protein